MGSHYRGSHNISKAGTDTLRRRLTLVIVTLTLLATVAIPFAATAEQTTATLRFAPQPLAVEAGQVFTLEVMVDDVVDLYGAQVYVDFNPAVLEVQAVAAGSLWGNSPDYAFKRLTYDNTLGQIDIELAMRSPSLPVTGSGSLATITLKAIATGNSDLSFVQRTANLTTMLTTAGTSGDPGDMEIPISKQNGQVEVYSLSRLEITPSTNTIAAGQASTYTARVYDSTGALRDTVTGSTTFTVDGAAAGTMLGATYVSERAGNWMITGSYSSPGGKKLVDTASLTVLPAAPATVAVVAQDSEIAIGANTLVVATVTDEFDNPVADGTSVQFSCTRGVFAPGQTTYAGTTTNGTTTVTFTATGPAGMATISAISGNASGNEQVNVISASPAPAASIEVSADEAEIVIGSTTTIRATVRDSRGNLVADGTVVVFSCDKGSFDGGVQSAQVTTSDGVATITFYATGQPGTAEVTATAGEAQGSVSVDVLAVTPSPGSEYLVCLPLVNSQQ